MRHAVLTGAILLASMTCTFAASDPTLDGPVPLTEARRPPERPSEPADAAPPAKAPPAPSMASDPLEKVEPLFRETDFDYSACLLTLHSLGASYQEQPTITEDPEIGCGIARPVQISYILPGIALPAEPVMRCETARQLLFWIRDFVIPATRHLPDHKRLTSIQAGSTYQCRERVGDSTTKLSEHGLGTAFDVMSLGFSDGSTFEVQPRQDQGDFDEAFQHTIQRSACLYFTTVLGPGANAAHDDHLHLDIKARNGGYRLCQ